MGNRHRYFLPRSHILPPAIPFPQHLQLYPTPWLYPISLAIPYLWLRGTWDQRYPTSPHPVDRLTEICENIKPPPPPPLQSEINTTRLHSSRMRTMPRVDHISQHALHWGGYLLRGGVCLLRGGEGGVSWSVYLVQGCMYLVPGEV